MIWESSWESALTDNKSYTCDVHSVRNARPFGQVYVESCIAYTTGAKVPIEVAWLLMQQCDTRNPRPLPYRVLGLPSRPCRSKMTSNVLAAKCHDRNY